jgi:hypothetical protein
MNEHTKRILERMQFLLREYREGDISLAHLVGSLEGSLSALEEKLPHIFYDTWYEHWGELETYLALGIEEEREAEILKEVEALSTQIKQSLK